MQFRIAEPIKPGGILRSPLLPPLAAPLVLGLLLGVLPGFNRFLHWNFFYIIPFGGLLFGALAASAQFLLCYIFNVPAKGKSVLWLVLAAAAGYFLVDYGIYVTTSFSAYGAPELANGVYRLADLMSFGEFLRVRMGLSSLGYRYGENALTFAAAGSLFGYLADLGGAVLGCFGLLSNYGRKYPFCGRCGRYKRLAARRRIQFKHDPAIADEIFGTLQKLVEDGRYAPLRDYCRGLSAEHANAQGGVRLVIDERFCIQCREGTLIGAASVRTPSGKWRAVSELAFAFTSGPGEHEPD